MTDPRYRRPWEVDPAAVAAQKAERDAALASESARQDRELALKVAADQTRATLWDVILDADEETLRGIGRALAKFAKRQSRRHDELADWIERQLTPRSGG